MALKESAQSFIRYVKEKGGFDVTTAEGRLKGALKASAGQGAPKGSVQTPNTEFKNAIQQELDSFMNTVMSKNPLTQNDYDQAFDETVKRMMTAAEEKDRTCYITFGRIQKIINIWIKYHVMLAFAEVDEALYGKYKALLPVAHVPVDKKVRVWFQEKLSDANNAAIVKTITSWKKYLTREQYYALQYDARDNASRFDAGSALELEARVMGEWQA